MVNPLAFQFGNDPAQVGNDPLPQVGLMGIPLNILGDKNIDFGKYVVGVRDTLDSFIRIQPYKIRLSSNASFGLKVKYCLFRIWNAVKAIFRQSDWQCAKRQLLQGPLAEEFFNVVKNEINDSKKFDLFKNSIEQFIEFALYFSIDGKLNQINYVQFSNFALNLLLQFVTDLKTEIDLIKDDPAIIGGFMIAYQGFTDVPSFLINIQPMVEQIALKMNIPATEVSGKNSLDIIEEIFKKSGPDLKNFGSNILKLSEMNQIFETPTIEAVKKLVESISIFGKSL